jgi:cell division protease FtsH
MNSVFKNALVWVLLGSALIFIFNNVENASSSKREMISYSQFKQEVLSDRIAKVVYKGDQMTIFGERLDGTRFETRHPIYKRDESVDNAIEEHGVITVFESVEQPSIWSQLLSGSFPNPSTFRNISSFLCDKCKVACREEAGQWHLVRAKQN